MSSCLGRIGIVALLAVAACGSKTVPPDGDGPAACVDVSSCDPHASCVDGACICNLGFRGDGETCDDVDECAEGIADCSTDATCTNTAGGFTCACKPGYAGDGRTCERSTPCTDGTAGCSPNATCSEGGEPGSYRCDCLDGFEGDGVECADVDECAAGTAGCSEHATCANTAGGFTCECEPGWAGDGKRCDDVDECALGIDECDEAATCWNTAGGYQCFCDVGWSGDGFACSDVDECADGTAGCDPAAVCTNLPGSFTCECPAGFEGSGNVCVDVDECRRGLAGCSPQAVCTNTNGGFDCACLPGYQGDGFLCDDVDECSDGTADCAPDAVCTNTSGSFGCSCPPGWEGDGRTCVQDACATGAASCSTHATCVNLPAGFECVCSPGWEGDGFTCTDVDECAAGTAGCAAGATCTNTEGSSSCACDPPLVGDGHTCNVPCGPGLAWNGSFCVAEGELSIGPSSVLQTSAVDVTLYIQEPGNLVVNGGFENGHQGWVVTTGGSNLSTGDNQLFGAACSIDTYTVLTRKQTIDLVAAGFDESFLDLSPEINVRFWIIGTPTNMADPYFVRAVLRDESSGELARIGPATDTNDRTAATTWTDVSHTFTGYAPGLRSVAIAAGGRDAEFWAGNFGARYDGISVTVGSYSMRISNDDANWTAWMPFEPSIPWTLDGAPGTNTVYVQFMDEGGNVYPSVSADIDYVP